MKTLGPLVLLLTLTVSASAQIRETPVSTGPLGPAVGNQMSPLAATDGTDFFVVWNDYRGGTFGTRVTHDGNVVDKTGIFLTTASPRALLWCGGVYVLVYSGNNSTGIVRFTADAHIIDGPRNITNSYVGAAATNGSTIVLAGPKITILDDRAELIEEIPSPVLGASAWGASSNGSTYELAVAFYANGLNGVYSIPLDAHGHPQEALYLHGSALQTLVTPEGAGYRLFFGDVQTGVVMTYATTTDATTPSPLLGRVMAGAVTTTTNGYLLATTGASDPELEVIRGSGGTIVDPQSFATTSRPAIPSGPAFATAGDNTLFVWSENPSADANVRGVILDGNGHPKSSTFDLTLSAPSQQAPAIATGAANDLVAWQEGSGIYAARVSPEGVPLDGRGMQLSTTGFGPRVVRDGSAYVVTWFDDRVFDLRWIDASSGTPIGGTITVDISGCSLARDDVGMVLFFTDADGHVEAQRIGMAGTIGPAVRLTPDGVSAASPTAVWNGHEWLVLWDELRLLPIPFVFPLYASTVKAERVTESLSVVDSQPLQIADFPNGIGDVAVATNGDEFFLAWSDTDPTHIPGVYARTVSAAGVLSDPTLLVAAAGTDVKSAAWDGSHYAVAYAVRRDDPLYAFRLMLTHAGVGDQLAISTAALDQHEVALAATPGRPVRAVYTRIAGEPQFGYVSRVFTRDLVYARRRSVPH
jgi:hypothetical protein